MEQLCRTCRHRGPAIHTADEDAGLAPVAVDTGLSVCMAMAYIGAVHVGPKDALAHGEPARIRMAGGSGVADLTGHAATFCVAPDFGCNRWAAAEVR
jgi:hypothetical protein